MSLVEHLTTFFSMNKISEASTFPELLQAFLISVFALYVTVFMIRAVFAATYAIRDGMYGGRR